MEKMFYDANRRKYFVLKQGDVKSVYSTYGLWRFEDGEMVEDKIGDPDSITTDLDGWFFKNQDETFTPATPEDLEVYYTQYTYWDGSNWINKVLSSDYLDTGIGFADKEDFESYQRAEFIERHRVHAGHFDLLLDKQTDTAWVVVASQWQGDVIDYIHRAASVNDIDIAFALYAPDSISEHWPSFNERHGEGWELVNTDYGDERGDLSEIYEIQTQ